MGWQRNLIIVTVMTSVAALVVTAIVTGRDAPVTVAGLLGTSLGIAFGLDAFKRSTRKDNHD